MRKLAKIAWLTCMMLVLASVNASAKGAKEKSSEFDWSPVIDAIIDVESEGNAKAVDRSGKSCGILQITPVMVKECNRIQAKRKSKKRYSLEDRFSVRKSKEMFVLFQSFYNPQNSIERAIRLWNGGIGYSKRATQKYFEKVMSKMK
jgi:hypothetical protein